MGKVSWAILAWATLGVVGAWVSDGASHVGGPGYPSPVPAWLLFEVWAVGFVLLATIGRKLFEGTRATPDPVSTEEPSLRRITSAILGWTVLWIVLVGIWALDPAGTIAGEGPGPRDAISLKPPDWVLFDLWFLGFVVLGVIWLVIRLRSARRPRPAAGT